MSCDNNDCPEVNPCYDNCGCLNPTTFECVTLPGVKTNIGVTADMNGLQVLAALDTKLSAIKDQILVLGGGITPMVDTKVKVTNSDTTPGFLNDKTINGTFVKKTILFPGANEKLKFDISISDLLSTDVDNQITLGGDNKIKFTAVDSSLYIIEGNGISITGTGTSVDPKVITATNSIKVVKSCYDGLWNNIPLAPTGNANVVYVSGQPQYRIRWDGTIEFKGTATYTVNFGPYTTGARKQTAAIGALSTACVSLVEQNGIQDLKGINYIDAPQPAVDQIVQQYGYIIKKNSRNIQIEFQSSFTGATSKTVVVSFDGAISHPNL